LPVPDSFESEISMKLMERICEATEAHAMPFSRFMQIALYEPGLGYYAAGKHKFGEGGDFVTAPELGHAFAYCIASQCQQVLTEIPGGAILEAGAGQGRLAADLLLELETRSSLPASYLILELSGSLRTIQKETLEQHAPHLVHLVKWIDNFPDTFSGVILGNELLDAMPVELFEKRDNNFIGMDVSCEKGALSWRAGRKLSQPVVNRLEHMDLPEGYRSEINLQAEAWIASAASILADGIILLVDYGFPRHEFYHPQRNGGTLMCHYRHHAHTDPLVLVGLQDITAHIDFTAMAESADENNLDVLGYTSQAAFLLACGLDRLVEQSDASNSRDHLQLTAEIKKLTHPSEMGELFKVIAFGKNFNEPLQGFTLQDRRNRL